jgi:hypothetical protein
MSVKVARTSGIECLKRCTILFKSGSALAAGGFPYPNLITLPASYTPPVLVSPSTKNLVRFFGALSPLSISSS